MDVSTVHNDTAAETTKPSQVNDDGSPSPSKNGLYQAQFKNPEVRFWSLCEFTLLTKYRTSPVNN
jgi:hypothetical protein